LKAKNTPQILLSKMAKLFPLEGHSINIIEAYFFISEITISKAKIKVYYIRIKETAQSLMKDNVKKSKRYKGAERSYGGAGRSAPVSIVYWTNLRKVQT